MKETIDIKANRNSFVIFKYNYFTINIKNFGYE